MKRSERTFQGSRLLNDRKETDFMAKAIKTIALVSAFILVVSSLTACSVSFKKDEPTTSTTTVPAPVITTEPETTTESEPETTTAPKEKEDTIEDIFDDIAGFESGTAGSSAKAAALALRLIAFSSSADIDGLADEIKAMSDKLSSDELDNYGEALYRINRYAKKFFNGEKSEVIEIAGNTSFSSDKEYSQEKYEQLYDLLKVQ